MSRLLFFEHALIFPLDHGGSQRGFLHAGKAQLFQCVPHAVDAHAVVVGGKGGGQADDHGAPLFSSTLTFSRSSTISFAF